MKCLSVRQPHASLLLGPKSIETRTWATKHRGWLGIHAGLAIDKYGPWDKIANGLVLPRGAIIGRVLIVDCRPMMEADEDAACTSYRPGLFAWVRTEAEHFNALAPMKGRLGLFEVEI